MSRIEPGIDFDLSGTGLRPARHRDWPLVADITAEGFSEDPVNTWVFGPHRAILSANRILARDIYLKAGFGHLHGTGGSTMWLQPGAEAHFGALTQLKFAIGMARHGSRGALARAMELGARMAAHHPKAPHMYLFTITTRKASRGKGVGKALLAPVLAYCDAHGIPAYLENSNPANTGFYRSHGFERTGLFDVGDGGPVMEPMWREARGES